ncbi:MAG: zinc-ribbon domain-containing protein [Dehalococcoidia bacterium]|nr:zinc-ribbon domain-containing protein [Dehalococcoidia bacterium]
MFCSKCGAENADTAKFCRKCGAPLRQVKPPTQASVKPSAQAATGPPVSHTEPAATPITPVQPSPPARTSFTPPVFLLLAPRRFTAQPSYPMPRLTLR